MSMRAKLIPVAVACGMAGNLAAQESEAPDLSFLEYLGSWEDGDDEWVVVAELEERETQDEIDGEADEAEATDEVDDNDEQDESDAVDGTEKADETDAD